MFELRNLFSQENVETRAFEIMVRVPGLFCFAFDFMNQIITEVAKETNRFHIKYLVFDIVHIIYIKYYLI